MEILNRDLKSNLKIDHFMGRDLNAVLIQMFATLTAYLLIALFRIFHNSLLSPEEVRMLLRILWSPVIAGSQESQSNTVLWIAVSYPGFFYLNEPSEVVIKPLYFT